MKFRELCHLTLLSVCIGPALTVESCSFDAASVWYSDFEASSELSGNMYKMAEVCGYSRTAINQYDSIKAKSFIKFFLKIFPASIVTKMLNNSQEADNSVSQLHRRLTEMAAKSGLLNSSYKFTSTARAPTPEYYFKSTKHFIDYLREKYQPLRDSAQSQAIAWARMKGFAKSLDNFPNISKVLLEQGMNVTDPENSEYLKELDRQVNLFSCVEHEVHIADSLKVANEAPTCVSAAKWDESVLKKSMTEFQNKYQFLNETAIKNVTAVSAILTQAKCIDQQRMVFQNVSLARLDTLESLFTNKQFDGKKCTDYNSDFSKPRVISAETNSRWQDVLSKMYRLEAEWNIYLPNHMELMRILNSKRNVESQLKMLTDNLVNHTQDIRGRIGSELQTLSDIIDSAVNLSRDNFGHEKLRSQYSGYVKNEAIPAVNDSYLYETNLIISKLMSHL